MSDNVLRLYEDGEGDYRPAASNSTASTEPQARDGKEDRPPIEVLVDEQGVVSDVLVQAEWRTTIAARDLGGALREAANKAIMNRVVAQVEGLDLNAAAVAHPTSHRQAPSAHGDPTSPVAENLVNEVLELFSRFDAELASYAARARQVATTTSRGEGPGGQIVVTVTAGQVSRVAINDRWAAAARHTEIQAEAVRAFRAAFRSGAAVASADIPVPPSIARLQELASDPEALCRQLGLSR